MELLNNKKKKKKKIANGFKPFLIFAKSSIFEYASVYTEK